MKHLAFFGLLMFSLSAQAKAGKIQCETKAKELVKAILTVQDGQPIVRVEVLSAKREEDDLNAYETFDVQGYIKDKGKTVPVRVPSRIVLFPEFDTCALIGYSLPTAG